MPALTSEPREFQVTPSGLKMAYFVFVRSVM
jgi:hypothetical protein